MQVVGCRHGLVKKQESTCNNVRLCASYPDNICAAFHWMAFSAGILVLRMFFFDRSLPQAYGVKENKWA